MKSCSGRQGRNSEAPNKVKRDRYVNPKGLYNERLVANFLTAGAIMMTDNIPNTTAPQTPIQKRFGSLAPKMADLTDNVLFGDVWERPQLSKRDRSLVTVSALVALYRPDQLRSHLSRARDNGLTQDELVEAITHLAFYAGWPSAVTALDIAKEVFAKK